MNKLIIFALMLATILAFVNFALAGGKGHDVIILGGHGGGGGHGGYGGHGGGGHGCGPGLVMKTGKKGKGNVIIMNNCHKKHHYHHEQHHHHHHHMPEYHHEEYHHDDHHGYGGDHGGY